MEMDWNACTVGPGKIATLRCIPVVMHSVIQAALVFAGITAVVFIIFAGYKFMVSGGDPKQVDSARKAMLFAVLGLTLVLASFAIINVIATATRVDCINRLGFDQCRPSPTPTPTPATRQEPGIGR